MKYVFFDVETHPVTDFDKAPKIVCIQIIYDQGEATIIPRHRADVYLKNLLAMKDLIWVNVSIRFDFACTMREWPEFTSEIFKLYEEQRVIDLAIYEKQIMLANHGYVASRELPSGKTERLLYNLGAIAYRRLGITLKGKDEEDSWRTNFSTLDGWEVKDYPPEASEYALDDVRILPSILASQMQENVDFCAAPLSAAADFALYLMTCQGVDIDPEERARVQAWVDSELTEERLEPLYESGILRRPEPSKPYANQAKRLKEILEQPVIVTGNTVIERNIEYFKSQGIKFTEPKPASINKAILQQIITEVATANEIPIRMTDGGKDGLNPQVSTSDEFMQEIEHLDQRLAAYAHRQRLGKIVSTELPRIAGARVHPNYDVLKETGRTSSWDPNIQNVDPRVRGCYIPPPGWVILSVDYAAIELVTLAQKLLQLFGKSTLAELINNGIDPHAYLGGRLAWELDRDGFQNALVASLVRSEPMELYENFKLLKKGSEKQQEYYSHWRTLAKPTGLGYPGGLGPDTFITFAKATYGVIVTREQAEQLRNIWFDTYPEMREYFNWVNRECSTGEDDYFYYSPVGMLRNHCSYCACANGAALQTPAAEGGKLALWEVVKRCFDPEAAHMLYGCKPWGWIHDQILLCIPEDEWMHERAEEVQRIMVGCMKLIIPDVAVRTEATLTRRWNKFAKPVFDSNGRLTIWEPTT